MRVLLSTIGSRGDVQPLVALGSELKALGLDVHLCTPPDFREWIEGLGMSFTPIGPEVRSTGKAATPTGVPTPEQRRRMVELTVASQFATIAEAAEGCDVILGATALQVAAPSVAERLGVPYVFAAYAPAALPSSRHAPPVLSSLGETPTSPLSDYSELWARDAARWNETWSSALNGQRSTLGLEPVGDVRSYVLTSRPWLAADPVLAPWPEPGEASVKQSGAWILTDARPLPRDLETFLAGGEPPIYFGFGSARAPANLSRVMIESARALARRAVLSRGWADLSLVDGEPDCIAIDEVNQQALFQRVAAVVHHGGAGTTTAAARSGAPQVVVPQLYDQHYWAGRVAALGIGTAHPPVAPTAESLTEALRRTLEPEVGARARSLAKGMKGDGAAVAARALMAVARGARS